MPVREASSYFNSPAFAQAAGNLASLFAPPSGQDAYGWAKANAEREAASRLSALYENPEQPDFDRRAIVSGLYTPVQSFYAQDQNNATTQRGQDITAATSVRNNQTDNERAILTNAADNAAALQRQYAQPVTASKDQTVFLPHQTAAATGLDPVLNGPVSPVSMDQYIAQQFGGLRDAGKVTDDQIVDAVVGKETPVVALGPDGKTPIYMAPGQAARTGARAAPKEPGTVINTGPNGAPIGEPEKGLVWARNADGTVKLDDRGVPIALPYQGGSVYSAQQAATKAGTAKDEKEQLKNDIVLQDIDRSLGGAGFLTTGFVGQMTGGVGGTPAHDLSSLLDTIKANVGFDRLQAMRDASPTGGALGQVSESENRLLQSVLGSLESSQSAPQLKYNLGRLRNVYLDIIHGPGQGPARTQLGDDTNSPQSTPAASAPVGGPVQIHSKADYDALPSGTEFVAPDGNTRRKP